jgi:predicted small secreted protein
MKTLILAAVLAVFAVSLGTGCKTAEGFGEDMEKAGEKIQEKVD